MKRILVLILMAVVAAVLVGCTTNDIVKDEVAEYTADDVSAELQMEISDILTSLSITGYEVSESSSEAESSSVYVFNYVIKAGGVELVARGRGMIDTESVSPALAYISRSEDNKIIWSSTPGVDVYDWKTGEPAGQS